MGDHLTPQNISGRSKDYPDEYRIKSSWKKAASLDKVNDSYSTLVSSFKYKECFTCKMICTRKKPTHLGF